MNDDRPVDGMYRENHWNGGANIFEPKKDNYVYFCKTCNKKLFLHVGKCFKEYYTLYIKRYVTRMNKQLNMYVVMEKY